MTLTELLMVLAVNDLTEPTITSPNEYKRKTGRCPKGFTDDGRGRCVRQRKWAFHLRAKGVSKRGRRRRKRKSLIKRLREIKR